MSVWSLTYHTHTHTHTRLTALFLRLPRWAGTRKVKPILILLKQETVSGSGTSWAICKSASRSRQITTPVPHHSSFLQAGCPSCHPTNSVKALKAALTYQQSIFKRYHSDKDLSEFLCTRWQQKSNDRGKQATKLNHCHPMHILTELIHNIQII